MELDDPTLVFLLLTLGMVGVGVEAMTPGGIIPAVLGIIALVFGVIGLVNIGPTAIGIGLLLLAIVLFIAAVALRLYRPLSMLGVISLVASGIWMFDRQTDPTSIIAVTIGSVALGFFMLFVIERASRVKEAPVRYGPEDLVGMEGEVRVPLRPDGQVFVAGALWQARLADQDGRLGSGERITVTEVKGLTLMVSAKSASTEGDN